MTSEQARRVLARLAGDLPAQTADDGGSPIGMDYGETIDEARAALDDLEAAADFVDGGGLECLEAAVERADGDLSRSARDGREVLRAFREFRAVARGSEEERTSGEANRR